MDVLSDDFQELLELLTFTHLGSRWYRNADDTIRIRCWKDNEIDLWEWRGEGSEYNMIKFRGKLINPAADIAWLLKRCFKK